MEGKSIAVTLLLLSLVLGQIQVEARTCCSSSIARNCYNTCSFTQPIHLCASQCGCIIVSTGWCPGGWPWSTLENSGHSVNEYCKLGCSVSVCGAMTTIQNSDAGEVVNGTVEKCNNACSAFCTKNTIIAQPQTA